MKKFTKTKPVKSKIERIGVFDTETWGLDARQEAFAMGVCLWNESGEMQKKVFFDRQEMADFMVSRKFRGYTWYAHNAEYDLLVIYGNYMNLEGFDSPVYAGSRFISLKNTDQKNSVVFNDSLNLFPVSLAQLGKEIGLAKGTTPDKFINPGSNRKITKEDINYCVRDVEILYKAIINFHDLCYENWNIRAGCTIGQTALRIFTTNYLDDTKKISNHDVHFRKSYYGGRTEVLGGRKFKNLCYCYDFNSLYPSCMISGVYPEPSGLEMTVKSNINFIMAFEGVSRVKVKVPDQWYPPLPYKVKGSGKLIFPVGTFTGWYNHNELRPRITDGTIKVLEVYRTIYSRSTWMPFSGFIEDLYRMRLEAKHNGEYVKSLYVKYLMNSLYGKFGQKRRMEEIGHTLDEKDDGWYFFPFNSDTDLGLWKMLDDKRKVVIQDSPKAIISLASYTTSYARMKLFDAVTDILKRGGRVFYTDTDSVFTDIQLEESDDLGKLKLEHYGYITPIAPKMYEFEEIGTDEEDRFEIINHIIKVKGVSRPGSIAGNYEMRRIAKLKESNRRNLMPGSPLIYIKNISDDDSKRIWFDNGESLPIRMGSGSEESEDQLRLKTTSFEV